MAKVAFSKLKCKVNEEVKVIDFNGEKIEVKQYLPLSDKLNLITKIIELAHEDDYNYSNPIKIDTYTDVEILFAYTNISFTDKLRNDIEKLYDSCASSGLFEKVFDAIPESELVMVQQGVEKSVLAVYTYLQSAVGILDALKEHKELDIDFDNLRQDLENLQNNSFLTELLPLLDTSE